MVSSSLGRDGLVLGLLLGGDEVRLELTDPLDDRGVVSVTLGHQLAPLGHELVPPIPEGALVERDLALGHPHPEVPERGETFVTPADRPLELGNEDLVVERDAVDLHIALAAESGLHGLPENLVIDLARLQASDVGSLHIADERDGDPAAVDLVHSYLLPHLATPDLPMGTYANSFESIAGLLEFVKENFAYHPGVGRAP